MHCFTTVIFLLPTLVAGLGINSNYSRLYDDLLRNYNQNLRPAGPNGSNVTYIVLKPRLYSIIQVMFQSSVALIK